MLNNTSLYAGSDSDSDAASSRISYEDTTFYLVHQENDSEDEAAAANTATAMAAAEGTTSTVLGGGGSGFDVFDSEEQDCQNSAGSAVVVPKDVTTTATSTTSGTTTTMTTTDHYDPTTTGRMMEEDIKSFENETIVIPQSFDVATQYERKEGRHAVTLIQDDSTEAIHVPEEDDEDESVTAAEDEQDEDITTTEAVEGLYDPIQMTTRMKRISFQTPRCTRSILQVFGMVLISVLILTPYMYHARERTLLRDEISSLQTEIKELEEALVKPEPDVQVDNCWFNAKASMGMCSKEQLDSLKEVSNEVWDQFYSVMDWVNTPSSMEEGEKSSPLNKNPLSKSLLEILYPSSSGSSSTSEEDETNWIYKFGKA